MAVTKIKALTNRLDNALNYIQNFSKTENGELIYGYACSPIFADSQMKTVRLKANSRGNRVGYHLIQSFDPDDPLTPEQAFEFGKQFASKVLGGNYQFVIATHSDREHIHNHIIFNSVSFTTKKKYVWNQKEKLRIRAISDEICRENGLSVIEETSGIRGMNWFEKSQHDNGKSWKTFLMHSIDEALSSSTSFDDFVNKMEKEYGIKMRVGKTITFSFSFENKEYSCRDRRLGEAYSVDSLHARIGKSSEKVVTKKSKKNEVWFEKKLRKIVDVRDVEKAKNSIGYANAIHRSNANTRIKSFNLMREKGYESANDLITHYYDLVKSKSEISKKITSLNKDIMSLSEEIKYAQDYNKYKKLYDKMMLLSGDKRKDFEEEHESELIDFAAASIYYSDKNTNPASIDVSELFANLKTMRTEKNELFESLNSVKNEIKDLSVLKYNLEKTLGYESQDSSKVLKTEQQKNEKDSSHSL